MKSRVVTEENRRRRAEWEREHEVNEVVKQILNEAHAATSASILEPALLAMNRADKTALGLQALTVLELRRIATVLESKCDA